MMTEDEITNVYDSRVRACNEKVNRIYNEFRASTSTDAIGGYMMPEKYAEKLTKFIQSLQEIEIPVHPMNIQGGE